MAYVEFGGSAEKRQSINVIVCMYPREGVRGTGRRGRSRGATRPRNRARRRSTTGNVCVIGQRELRVRTIVGVSVIVDRIIAHPCGETDDARDNNGPFCKDKIGFTQQQRYNSKVDN